MNEEHKPKRSVILADALAWLGFLAGGVFAAYSGLSTCGTELWSEANRRSTAPTWIAWSAPAIVAGGLSLAGLLHLSGRDKLAIASQRAERSCAIGCFAVFVFVMGSILVHRLSLLGR